MVLIRRRRCFNIPQRGGPPKSRRQAVPRLQGVWANDQPQEDQHPGARCPSHHHRQHGAGGLEAFTYLSSTVSSSTSLDAEISFRSAEAAAVMAKLHIWWQDRVTKTEVLERAGSLRMSSLLVQRRLRWLGNAHRMERGRASVALVDHCCATRTSSSETCDLY